MSDSLAPALASASEFMAAIRAGERRALARAVERGALQPVAPAHTILSRRPEFRWIPEPGAATYQVRLATDQARPEGTDLDSSRRRIGGGGPQYAV